MSHAFHSAVRELGSELSLDLPDALPDIVNLQVDDWVVHVTEHPDEAILMFCCIDYGDIAESEALFHQNLFGVDLLKPILSREAQSNDWLLWNRQALKDSSPASLCRQLEQLSDVADQMVAGVLKSV